MKKIYLISLLLLMVALALVSCGSVETPAPTGVSETSVEPTERATELVTEVPATDVAEEPTDVPEPEPTQEPEPTLAPTATPLPTPTPVVIVDVDSACVACHTDVERLKELAEEPEVVELSSGEG